MRLRHIPGARERVCAHPLVVTEEAACSLAGRWQTRFAAVQPLLLEIGTGRGRFLTAQAALQPGCNYIGLELREETILDALCRLDPAQPPQNLLFLHANAERLTEFFAAGELDQIYLLFSDPWPKQRHAKRRLTAPAFLHQYAHILKPAGRLLLKTDGAAFYDWSCATLLEAGWQLLEQSRDHPLQAAEPASEYEMRFREKGQPIYYALWAPPQL